MSEHDRYTLLTNISFVTHHGMRLHASAVVIARDTNAAGHQQQQVRLFGPSPAWPVCDVNVPLVAFTLNEHAAPSGIPKGARLVWRKYDLRFVPELPSEKLMYSTSVDFELTTNAQDGRALEAITFADGASISQVWDELVPAALRAWDAPFFPTLTHNSVEIAAQLMRRRW